MRSKAGEISRLKDGKVVFTAHAKVSADLRTLAVVSRGVSPASAPVEARQVYEKWSRVRPQSPIWAAR